MKNRIILFSLAVFGALLGSVRQTPVWAADLAIIINDGNGVQTISDSKLKNLFLKIDRYWGDDLTVTPVHRNEGSAVYTLFLSRIVGQSPSEALSYWVSRKQIDGSSPPIQVSEDRLVIRLVSTVKGAVGYVESTSLAGHTQGIRVIRTIKE
jgi:ABC-type phosphate transport system substrate-binding protein